MEKSVENNIALKNIKNLIATIAEKEGFKDFQLEIKAITTNGANFMGDLYLVDVIEDGKNTLKLFAKAANSSQEARKFVPTNKVYKTEVFMYTTMASTFDDLHKKHGVPEEKQFKLPKYYGSNLNEMEEVLVLENLAADGFELFDRLKPIDWEYARAAVEEIAKFHALSFALEMENPDIHEKLIQNIKTPFADSAEIMMESIKLSLPLALAVIEKDNYSKMKKYIDDNGHKLYFSMFEKSKNSVLFHGDYRMSNIMVKYQGSKVVSLKPVDYQTVSFGCPVNDLLYFLFTGSDEVFRRKHYENFFLHYHNTLTAQLKLLSQDIDYIYPRSAFYFDLKERLSFGLEVGLVTLGLVLIDPSEVLSMDEMIKSMTSSSTDAFKPNAAFVERINGIVRDFVRWGVLKDEDTTNVASIIVSTDEHNGAIQQSDVLVNNDPAINNEHVTESKNVIKKNNKCCSIF